ncbi:MAG: peptidylprolyl isomerase [Chloroflexota bacterium]
MGTFEKIRKTSPYLLGLFALLFIGFMVASDADISTLMRRGQDPSTAVIADINGDKILYKEYEERVRQAVEQQRAQQPNNEDFDDTQIRQQIWEQMIEEILLEQQAKNAGIIISDEQIVDQLVENPPEYLRRSFTDSTGFRRQAYLDLISHPENIVNYLGANPNQIPQEEKDKHIQDFRNQLIEIQKMVRRQMLTEHLAAVVTASSNIMSPTYVRNRYLGENSSADVSFVSVGMNLIDATAIKVSDDEIRAYYEKHKEKYKQKETAKLRYVVFPAAPAKDDTLRAYKRVQTILADIQSAQTPEQKDSIFDVKVSEYGGQTYDYTLTENMDKMKYGYMALLDKGDVAGPIYMADAAYFFKVDDRRTGVNESVKASHILISTQEMPKDSALALAKSIKARIDKGEDFAALAAQYSADKGSAQQGGDVGYFTKGKMVKPFEDAAFATAVGSVTEPVETQYGYHIIKVTGKQSDEIKYSEIRIPIEISPSTKNKNYRDAYAFAKQVEEGESFESLAKKLKLQAGETPYFDRTRPIFGSFSLTNQAFENEQNFVIQPIDIRRFGIIVAQVAGKRSEGFSPVDEVRPEITAKLKRIKQLDMLKNKAESVYNQIKNTGLSAAMSIDTSLKTFHATITNNGMVPGVGRDAVFTQTAFKVPVGSMSAPVRGENGYYIMIVNNRQVPDDATVKAKSKEYAAQLKSQSDQQAFMEWFQEVRQTADIQDYRSKFFKEF